MTDNPKLQRYIEFDPLLLPEVKENTIGEGTIGGKAKGIAFARHILNEKAVDIRNEVVIPESMFLATEVFEEFEVINNLQDIEQEEDFEEIEKAFINGRFPVAIERELRRILERITYPLAVRSSSKLEDDPKYSFAGKYLTTFIPNTGDIDGRLENLKHAIKLIYASVYGPNAVEYKRKHKLSGEQMAVIIQRLMGRERKGYFYPELAAVGFSRNYRRWSERLKQEDGVIRLVFGLGTRCTGRGYARNISLSNPNLRPEGQNPRDIAKYSQETFDMLDMETGQLLAVNINAKTEIFKEHPNIGRFVKVYLRDSDELKDMWSISHGKPGSQKYIFAFKDFPSAYPEILDTSGRLFKCFEEEMGVPVDIEFTFDTADKSYALVQLRPLSSYEEYRKIRVPRSLAKTEIILRGDRMLTNGKVKNMKTIVYVDPQGYSEAGDKYAVAREVGRINEQLNGEQYILIGPGRWGSTNPDLGVPVRYREIFNCSVLVELGISHGNYTPELSYGTHFFADLELDGVLYLPVFDSVRSNIINWEWFNDMPYKETNHPAVRVYEGDFGTYLDGERLDGVVVDAGARKKRMKG